MSSDTALRRVGTTIRDKWTLERLLGAGGMAAVYVGVHRIGRRDALKILHPQAAKSKEICDRFEREAQAANRFRHPGAVEIRDIDVAEDGAPFLVMELLDGESLAERERRLGRIPLAEVLGFTAQVLDTLGASRYMTLCLIKVCDHGLLAAGMHQDIFVYRDAQRSVERVETRGAWVGVLDDIEPYLEDVAVPLAERDLVLFFTDGITEATNPEGDMFGEERLEEVLRARASEGPEEVVNAVLAAVRAFEGAGAKPADDRTLVAARWAPPSILGARGDGRTREPFDRREHTGAPERKSML